MGAPETLITSEMRSRMGVESIRVSDPIDKSLIRQWALALSWPDAPDPLFWDEEYAKTTRFGGIIAPPFFNPFAYNITAQRVGQVGMRGAGATSGQTQQRGEKARAFRTA